MPTSPIYPILIKFNHTPHNNGSTTQKEKDNIQSLLDVCCDNTFPVGYVLYGPERC